eukprot:GFYU01020152.1.p1 GENE.GFYU01020152.1~~GFYU01020152.1.p1  ORF type:complete len:238 (-),score=49.20 GFYU01020152.1:216-929(-)
MVCSFHLLAGVSAAYFHRQRTGEGQLVDVNGLRCGIFAMQVKLALGLKNPKIMELMNQDAKEARTYFPVPTANSFKTKDGVWVQMLGVNMPKTLSPWLSALNVKYSTYARLLIAVLTQVLPSLRTQTMVTAIRPLQKILNETFERCISQITWEDLQKIFDTNNVWYNKVNMLPQALHHRQARASNVFGIVPNTDHWLLINHPTRLSCADDHGARGGPPSLGQHTADVESTLNPSAAL